MNEPSDSGIYHKQTRVAADKYTLYVSNLFYGLYLVGTCIDKYIYK